MSMGMSECVSASGVFASFGETSSCQMGIGFNSRTGQDRYES